MNPTKKKCGVFCFLENYVYICRMKSLIQNRRARFDYEFLDKYNAGLQLFGSEVKAIRLGEASVVDGFCYFVDNELFIKNFIIRSNSKFFEHDPNRDKKLLLNKKELKKIKNKMDKHLTIVPISIFLNERGKIKCEIAVSRGKKNYDKKSATREREIIKETKKEIKHYEI
jgi:SsrA-binding protein